MSKSANSLSSPGKATEQRVLQIDEELLWYRIKGALAVGDFSICYLCEDLNLGHPVRLLEYFPVQSAQRKKDQKLYPISKSDFESFNQGLMRFISTAESLVGITHPHVERVFDVFETSNTAYAVLAYHRQEQNLASVLEREGTLAEAKLLGILWPLLNGVERLIDNGLCHLALTPASILLGKDGRPILSSAHIINQAVVGNKEVLPIKTEILRLGAILYRAVTGIFPPEEHERLEARLRHGHDPYVPALLKANKAYSQSLLKAIDFALRLAPEEPPASIAEWRQAFEFCESSKDWSIAESFIDLDAIPEKAEEPRFEPNVRQPDLGSKEVTEHSTITHGLDETFPREAPSGAWRKTPWYRHHNKLAFMALVIVVCAGFYALTVKVPPLFLVDNTVLAHKSPPSMLQDPPNTSRDWNAPATSSQLESKTPSLADLPIEPPIPNQDKQHRIKRLLEQAAMDIREFRLTTPRKRNALEKYQQVLMLDPDNQDAKAGINVLATKYIELASREAKLKRLNYAVRYLEEAFSLSSESEDVQRMLSALRSEYATRQ